jgi:thermostable 8-oxoguanine DNA glycosylase
MKKIYSNDIDLENLISKADKNYKFQLYLTQKLDNHRGDFTEMTLLEIVLWKTNRYPDITIEILDDINNLRQKFSTEKAKILLRKLLSLKGFDLPMASTVLRFACPDHLQIIDQRVYRFITEGVDDFKKPYNDALKVEMYFSYIEKLKDVCIKYKIPFNKADRIIYQLDKELNADHPIKY